MAERRTDYYHGPLDPKRRAAWEALEAKEAESWTAGNAVLTLAMHTAITVEIDLMRGLSWTERVRKAQEYVGFIGPFTDQLLHGGKFCRATFVAIARAVAALSYQPGGVFAFGRRWCALPVEEAEADKADHEAGPWVHPIDKRHQRLVAQLGADWVHHDKLVSLYRRWGYSEDLLDLDLFDLDLGSQVEHQSSRTEWRKAQPKPPPPPPPSAEQLEARKQRHLELEAELREAEAQRQADLTEEQRQLGPRPDAGEMRTEADFRLLARWLEIEARRSPQKRAECHDFAKAMHRAADRRVGGLDRLWDPEWDGKAELALRGQP